MKLYYRAYTCSLSPHIVLRELGLPFQFVQVDGATHRTADGRDFLAINPKGYVAALELDDSAVLTEGPAIVQYLADLKPEAQLAPPSGTWERVRLQEWLNFITSEIHAGSAPLFHAELPQEAKAFFRERLFQRLDVVETTLGRQDFLLGPTFGVADAYLFTILGWFRFFGIGLERWPALAAYAQAIGRRPAVRQALQAEALAGTP